MPIYPDLYKVAAVAANVGGALNEKADVVDGLKDCDEDEDDGGICWLDCACDCIVGLVAFE